MYTREQIEVGLGLFTDRSWTDIFQLGNEDCFDTDEPGARPRQGWHLAGGGEITLSNCTRIEWCDLR